MLKTSLLARFFSIKIIFSALLLTTKKRGAEVHSLRHQKHELCR
jgi:hypothetical protein